MWQRLSAKFKGANGKRGYTLVELLTVAGIIAILCGVVMISAATIKRNMDFKQRNDYAKTIFMAAQTQISKMRDEGTLTALCNGNDNSGAIPDNTGFPEDAASQYRYICSTVGAGSGIIDSYQLVLPENSVEEQLRGRQVIIEYNPVSGNVYSVFYSEKQQTEANLLEQYLDGALSREDESARKEMMLGYYSGSVVTLAAEDEAESTMYSAQAVLQYSNGQEGLLTGYIPVPGAVGSATAFLSKLDVKLTMVGEISGGSKELTVTPVVEGGQIVVRYTLDSLKDGLSFASASSGLSKITSVTGESSLTVLPGENVTLKLSAAYNDSQTTVDIEAGILSGVNPLFQNMLSNPDGSYTVTVSNGRHLQNLNALSPTVAKKVSYVSVYPESGDTIDWAETVAYYGESYANSTDACAARALPYFVPIQNDSLFGSAGKADLAGNGFTVSNLKVDSTQYKTGSYYVNQSVSYTNCGLLASTENHVDISALHISGGSFQAAGTVGAVAGRMTGGTVSNCSVSDTVTLSGATAMGGIVGSSSARISNCSTGAGITYSGSSTTAKIGGVAGQVSGGSVSGCAASGTISTVTGYVGGITGFSSASITDCETSLTITYKPGTTSDAVIGGLVGQLNAGASLENCTAGGAVTLGATPGTKAHFVGGVVGIAEGSSSSPAVCTGVNSAVTVDTALAGSASGKTNVTDPSKTVANGSVGMFVGYVNYGNFTDCTTTATNSQYQFLGEIQQNGWAEVDDNTDTVFYYWHAEANADQSSTSSTLEQLAADNHFTDAGGVTYPISHAGTLNSCVFQCGSTSYYQQLGTGNYLYKGTAGETSAGGYIVSRCGSGYVAQQPWFSHLVGGTDTETDGIVETLYYYKESDDTYSLVSIMVENVTTDDGTRRHVQLYKNGEMFFEDTMISLGGPIRHNTSEEGMVLYLNGIPTGDGYSYMITDTTYSVALLPDTSGRAISALDLAAVFGTTEYRTKLSNDQSYEFIGSNEDFANALWTVKEYSGATYHWTSQNTSGSYKYLYLGHAKMLGSSAQTGTNYRTYITDADKDGGYVLQRGNGGNYWVTYSSGTFARGTSECELGLLCITGTQATGSEVTIAYDNAQSEDCIATEVT